MKYLKMQINIHVLEVDAAIVFLKAGFSVCPMGDGDDSKKITGTAEMGNLSLNISTTRSSRDLLQRFMGSASEYEKVKDQDEETELNLGLSLGGRFGVDKSSKKLVRSSSIASCLPVVRDDNDVVAPPTAAAYTGLVRTSSLPLETEEEWRKRKELQTLRRMEAKRRRLEKLRNLKGDCSRRGSLSLEERKEIEVNLREKLERKKCLAAVKRLGSSIGSQGPTESKEGSSSGVTDLESKTLQGSSGELSPGSIQSLQERSNQDVGGRSSSTKTRENTNRTTVLSETKSPSKSPDNSRTQGREIPTNSMEDMPCVFTKGDGPNGRRVDGILYRYGRGEEVRIMCICHGSFHSPAEFVKHAGGTDVDHPLKHIVVNSNACSL